MRSLLIIFLLLSFFSARSDNFKSAMKLIEKGKYEKAHDKVQKSLRKTDTNPGAYYVLSVLYLNLDYPDYNEDSAWNAVLLAEKQFAEVNEKTLKSLTKSGITENVIQQHKTIVDSAVFQTTLETNTIAAYNVFIENHPASINRDEAILKRDALAWVDAKSENTYQAYQRFLQEYPDSRQAKEAQELYEVLLYEGKTNDNSLTSYIQFLKDFPDSPYRKEAENSIFNIGVSGTNTSGYLWFLKNYPNSELAGKAINFLYHIYKEDNDPVGFLNHYVLEVADSILRVIEMEYVTLVPVYDNGLFGYNDTHWNVVLEPAYTHIEEEHLCGNISADMLKVSKDADSFIIGKTGSIIYSGNFDDARDIGYGFVKISTNGNTALWHKSGYRIFDFNYQDFEVLNGRLLKFKKEGLWGVASFTGIVMLENQYDEISSLSGFIQINKNGKVAVTNSDQIILVLDKKMPELEFYLDDVELVDENHLLGFLDRMETLIGPGLETLIPLEEHKIYRLNQGWIVHVKDSFKAFTTSVVPVFDTLFSKALYNERWLALKKEDKWVFFGNDRTFAEGFVYDSVQLLGPNYAYLQSNGKAVVFFNERGIVELPVDSRIRVLRPISWSTDQVPAEYLLVLDKNKKMVYDTSGTLVLTGVYDQVLALGNDYFLIQAGGRSGLADTKGSIILKPQYDAIGNFSEGYVSLLKTKKFGIFNHQKNIHINPQYDALLRPFNDSLLVANVNDKWGLVDSSNNRILEFDYKEIHPWNQDQVLVKTQDNLFNIVDLKSKHIVYSGIERYHLLRNDLEEKIAVILKRSQHGILSNKRGELISPGFTDIINLGTVEYPIYFAQRTIREAEFIVAVYYDADGRILKRLAMNEDEFDKVYCE